MIGGIFVYLFVVACVLCTTVAIAYVGSEIRKTRQKFIEAVNEIEALMKELSNKEHLDI